MRAGVPDRLSDTLARLKLTAVRDQLDGLLDEAGRQELSLREAPGAAVRGRDRLQRRAAHRDDAQTCSLPGRFRSVGCRLLGVPSRYASLRAPAGSAMASTCCCLDHLAWQQFTKPKLLIIDELE